jgi:cytochrome d ubiquinol oxidase subunit I
MLQPVIGHVLGLQVGDRQPAKLAAFELATHTEERAPLRLGGLLIDNQVQWALSIPRLGSVIARNSFDDAVPGLSDVPPDQRPPMNIVHLAFQTMVGIGTMLALFVLCFWIARWRRWDPLANRLFLRAAALAGPLAIVAVEAGWVATEVGRQPWVVWQVLRTKDAASANSGLWVSYAVALVVYAGMTVGAVIVLRSMARRWRTGNEDLATPYGPRSSDIDEQQVTEGAGR